MNARPFNFQWFVPCGEQHHVFFTRDGGMYVGPDNPAVTNGGELVALIYGGAGNAGRIFQIVGNDVAGESPIVAPDNVTPFRRT